LPPSGVAEPPNLRSRICGPNRNRNADEDFAIPIAGMQNANSNVDEGPAAFFMQQRQQSANPALVALATGDLGPRPVFQPVPVYVGRAPGWSGASRQALTDEAADPTAAAAPRGQRQRGTTHAATQPNPHKPLPPAARSTQKPGTTQARAAQPGAKPKPAQAAAQPGAKPAARTGAKPATKPAAKPATKPAASAAARPKPAPKPQAQTPKPPPRPQASAPAPAVR
jgi:hypothetical protein